MNIRKCLKTLIRASILLLWGASFQTSLADGGHLEKVQASGIIRIATNPGIEPMEYMRGGQLVGYDIDVGIALARHLKVEVNWIVFDDLNNLVRHIHGAGSEGKLDIVISAMGIDDKRTQNSVAVPYFKSGLTILTNAATKDIATLNDLKGKTVAAVRGSTEYEIISQAPGVTVVDAQNYDECVSLVLSGRASAAVLDVPVALVAARRHPNKLRVVDNPFEEESYGIFMERSDLALFREVRKAVKEMRRDGTFDRLKVKWF